MESLSFSLLAASFLLGCFVILVLEIIGVVYLIKRLNRKNVRLNESAIKDLDLHQSMDFPISKQGAIWVLESNKIAKNKVVDSVPKEQKSKQELVEVLPVRKLAKLRDGSLILTGLDASRSTIALKGCTVQAVSATGLPSRKWAKRFPIKLESKTSAIYNGNKIIYIYAETAWEKESWCKALRLACTEDKQLLNWVAKLNVDFHSYLASLNAEYPWFVKPSTVTEPFLNRANKLEGSSKVRLFLKKLTKKASSRTGAENKLVRDDKKTNERFHPYQESALAANLSNKVLNNGPWEETAVLQSSSSSVNSSHCQYASDAEDSEEKHVDEGTLCWNLLISRLFFDVKSSSEVKSSIQARIQRTMSNMRKPSYIGEIICTNINLGTLPPYIHGMRVLPADMNEVWALEADVEYSGGVILDIETRLEVRELGKEEDIVNENSESTPVGDVRSDLLEGIEYYGKQLNIKQEDAEPKEKKNEGDSKPDGLKNCKSSISASAYVSKWKTMVNSIAKQVSQVPLSLKIRVSSLRGTVRLHIKPPPTDQLWFTFTSMPDIEFDLQSSVGDHKITSGHIALFLINRFKASIRETMVLPNFENIGIPWMLAEKDDWVPRKVAPFMWLNQDTNSTSSADNIPKASISQPTEDIKVKTEPPCNMPVVLNDPEIRNPKQQQNTESSLTEPLLMIEEPQEKSQHDRDEIKHEYESLSRSVVSLDKNISVVEDDGPKKLGRRARMLDLGKKMGEKLEEKRRHFEEKSRSIVDRMRKE